MLISDTNGSLAQAPQSPRPTGNSAPTFVVEAPSSIAAKPALAEQQAMSAHLQNAVDNINKALKQSNKSLEFSVDESTKIPLQLHRHTLYAQHTTSQHSIRAELSLLF